MKGSRFVVLRLYGCIALCALTVLGSASIAQAEPTPYDQLATASPVTAAPSGPAPASDDADLPLGTVAVGPNVTLTGAELEPRGSKLRLSASLKLRCPAGGDIRAGISENLRFSGLNRWSVSLAGVVGPNGCALADGFSLAAGTTAQITLRAADGRLSVTIDVSGTIKTTIIPTKTSFAVSIRVLVGRGEYAVSASGRAAGAEFTAQFASDGTFALDFGLTDVKLGRVSLGVTGRAARVSPGAPVEVTFRSRVSEGTQVAPGLALFEVNIGLSRGDLTLDATIRLRCKTGTVELKASGVFKKTRDISLSASGVSSACALGKDVVLDGSVYGKIASTDGRVTFDLGATFSRLDLGWVPLSSADRLGIVIERFGGRLTNTCDGCEDIMRIEGGASLSLALDNRTFAAPLVLGSRLELQIDLTLPDFQAEFVSLAVLNLNANGFKLPTSIVLQSTLEKRIYEVFSTPFGRSSGSRLPCPNPNCITSKEIERPGVEGAGTTAAGPTSKARVRIVGLTVGVERERAEVRVRLSAASAVVRMDVQRRRCLVGTCTWALEAYARSKTDARGVVRYTSPGRLARGSYRIVARAGGPKSRAIMRTFRVT